MHMYLIVFMYVRMYACMYDNVCRPQTRNERQLWNLMLEPIYQQKTASKSHVHHIYIYSYIYVLYIYIVNAACHLLGNKFINKSQFEAQRRWGNRISQTRSAFTGSPSKWALESTLNLPHIRSSWFCETNVLLSLGSVRNGLDLV